MIGPPPWSASEYFARSRQRDEKRGISEREKERKRGREKERAKGNEKWLAKRTRTRRVGRGLSLITGLDLIMVATGGRIGRFSLGGRIERGSR